MFFHVIGPNKLILVVKGSFHQIVFDEKKMFCIPLRIL